MSEPLQEKLLTVMRGQFHVLDDLLAITKCHDCGESYHKLILQRLKMAQKNPSMRGMFLCRSCSTKRCENMYLSQVDDQKYDTPPSESSEESPIPSPQSDSYNEIDVGWFIFD
jgi:hypothetical protein